MVLEQVSTILMVTFLFTVLFISVNYISYHLLVYLLKRERNKDKQKKIDDKKTHTEIPPEAVSFISKRLDSITLELD